MSEDNNKKDVEVFETDTDKKVKDTPSTDNKEDQIVEESSESRVIENKDRIVLDEKTRKNICNRHQFLQGTWNFERMQNGGWAYSMIPAIKALYKDKDSQSQALKRHLEFYNTHPYVSAPVLGVTLAMEEERANGTPIDDAAINGVKVGMMGPLAGVGDPVFWFTIRPILGALGACLLYTSPSPRD